MRGEGAAASVESDSYRPVVASALVERWEHEGPQVAVNVVLSGGRGGGGNGCATDAFNDFG